MRNRILILLLLVCPGIAVYGNIIAVTSNSDDGPGSLRDALRIAAADGTAATDTILFNLPDQSEISHAITLLFTLPVLMKGWDGRWYSKPPAHG